MNFDFNEFEKRDDLRHPDPLSDTTSMNKHEYTHTHEYIVIESRIGNPINTINQKISLDILVQKYQKCKI